ncbi:MAG TPA: biopolymer transporter ExbD [Haliangiales bacterium]|nr:biopolymer transporter ExbD [Haliangiales bacterium]
MAGGSRYEDEEAGGMITDINVTPLVDITLVLLIIFMVTARLIVNKAIPGVDTPKAASGEEVRTTLALTIDQSRALFVNGQKVTDGKQMEDMLRRAVIQNPDVQAVVTADNSVPYGDFVQLIDAVRLSGIKKYALTVTEKPKEK